MFCRSSRAGVGVLLAILLNTGNMATAARDGRPRVAKAPCKVEREQLKVEEELRVALRTLRQSIDAYKMACEMGQIGPLDRKVDDECYPPNWAALINGVKPPNQNVRIRYLRRIPIDPTTGQARWGLRSMQDDPEAMKWGGQNIFDVYSMSAGTALDGTKYKDW